MSPAMRRAIAALYPETPAGNEHVHPTMRAFLPRIAPAGLSAPQLTGQGIETVINNANRAYARGLGIDLGSN